MIDTWLNDIYLQRDLEDYHYILSHDYCGKDFVVYSLDLNRLVFAGVFLISLWCTLGWIIVRNWTLEVKALWPEV